MSIEPASISKLLVFMPSWVGDAVMSTPALRAIRGRFPHAQMAMLLKPYIREVVANLPYYDKIIETPARSRGAKKANLIELIRHLREERFDLAILLTNSFRSALVARMAKIEYRVGYDRDGRGLFLTDRLLPHRYKGSYVPVPLVEYYRQITNYLGCENRELTLELACSEADDRDADALLDQFGIGPQSRIIVINPGANYGKAKCWYPDRFAAVADALYERFEPHILISGSPKERGLTQSIVSAARHPLIDLAARGTTLGILKSIIRRSALLITTDSGPRHYAAAFDVPVVTLFGPTDPRWTDTHFDKERVIRVQVECGPCQLRTCPLDHRCMRLITHEEVFAAAVDLLATASTSRVGDAARV